MSIATFEREQLGTQLTIPERLFGGLLALTAAAGHAALDTAAVVLFYVVLVGV